ncbi:MAG: hypothetical protein ACFNWZ_01185 [Candidatus Absconditicoccaceae bacterium]
MIVFWIATVALLPRDDGHCERSEAIQLLYSSRSPQLRLPMTSLLVVRIRFATMRHYDLKDVCYLFYSLALA